MALSAAKQVRLGQRFSSSLCNLSLIEMYWHPRRRRVIARSVVCSRRFALPRGVIWIGVYAHPCGSREFLGDLDDLLAKLNITGGACAAAARAG